MPRVKFAQPANVRDRNYAAGQEADLDDDAAKDVVKSKVGVIVAPEVRTAEDKVAAAARKAVSRREA
jgi:hypothetical protein